MAIFHLVLLLQLVAGCWGSPPCPTNHTADDWPDHTNCKIFVVNPNQDTSWLPSEAPEFNCTCYGDTPWQSCPNWTIPIGMNDVDIVSQSHELHEGSCSSSLTIKSNQKEFTRPRIQVELLCTAQNNTTENSLCANLTFRKAGNEERCSVDTDCWSLDQECNKGKCACSGETPIFSPDDGRCHSARYLGEPCVWHAQCQNKANNSVCDGGFCRCKMGYATQDDVSCQEAGVGGHCNSNSDCISGDMHCTGGKCSCPSDDPDYDAKLNKCVSGKVSSAWMIHSSAQNLVLLVSGAICIIGRGLL